MKPLCSNLFVLATLCLICAGGCSRVYGDAVPADFELIVDAQSADDAVLHVHIEIDAQGRGRYDRYDTQGAIRGDANNMVTYERSQVVESGEFSTSVDELGTLWSAIEENRFFELTEDYRMARGLSYAFVAVEADGRKHQVFNIGMVVPEMEAMVGAVNAVLPAYIKLEYREDPAP